MAALGQKFDATAHDTTQSDYSELPNGIYLMEIEASEVKDTSTGSGKILKTTNVVIEPEEYKGRKLFNNYNLENKNAQAQEIGQKQFAALCRALSTPDEPVTEVEDSEELHFKSFTVKVGLGKPSKDGQYPARAEIKRYFFRDEGDLPEPAVDDVQPAKPAANDNKPAPAQNAAAASGKKRPWG